MNYLSGAVLTALSLILFASCAKDKPIDSAVYDPTPYVLAHGAFPSPDLPADNPVTEQGVALGRMLFYEPMLSLDGSMACASCHVQENAFTDTSRFSIGVEGLPGGRQSMSVFNMAWNSNQFFWDGRANLLRDQSLLPIQDELELNETLDNVVGKIESNQEYLDQFTRAFGSSEVSSEKMSKAMEQFMFTIVSVDSKYDRWLAGTEALNESEERGRQLFFAEYNPFFPAESGADCAHCHGGPNFENDSYMNNGLDLEADFTDLGRENATELAADRAKFKVPSLRNIALTAPYMHDGRFSSLEEVVNHYNSDLQNSATLDPALEATMSTGLMLDVQDKADLVAFLGTLTDYSLTSRSEYANPFE